MKRDKLYEAFNYIDDWYLDIVDAPQKETISMNRKHVNAKKTLTYILAAALCISLLAITAAAAGWIPNIFASVKPVFPEDAEVLEAALQVTQQQEPETVTVPEVDFTQFTLYERYYDGDSILLGYDLSKVIPETVVGFQPEEALLSKIKEMAEYEHTPIYGQTNDTLEQYVALGVMTQEECDVMLEDRTDHAKQFDLRKYWQIHMDLDMKHTLTADQYEYFWDILSKTGSCCVAIPSQPWISDHVFVNDTDCGEVLGPDCGSFRTDYSTEEGECMVLHPLPEAGRNQDTVTVTFNLRSGWNYWYMELDGDVYHYFESNTPYPATFTLENVNS